MTDDGDTMTSPLSEPSTRNNIPINNNSRTSCGQSTRMQVCSSTTVPHAGCHLLTFCQLMPEALCRCYSKYSAEIQHRYSSVHHHPCAGSAKLAGIPPSRMLLSRISRFLHRTVRQPPRQPLLPTRTALRPAR